MPEKPTPKEFVSEEKALAIIRALSNPKDVDELKAFLQEFEIPKKVFKNSVLQQGIEILATNLAIPFGSRGPDKETQELIDFLRKTFSLYNN